MSSKSMSLKAKINNYAKSRNIAAQVVLQNFMFEHLLERISVSAYRDKFIIKGGMLISSLVGLDTRSTMDLDTTLRHLQLSEGELSKVISEICAIDLKDDIIFELTTLIPERENDRYGGFCAKLLAIYDNVTVNLSIDITTGDIVTPAPIEYDFCGIFDSDKHIPLFAYNIETILAEKAETIISRNVLNTRMRDFYDIYILLTTRKLNKDLFWKALESTANHRGTFTQMNNFSDTISIISENTKLKSLWKAYCRKFNYAKDIEFEMVTDKLSLLLNRD